MSIGLFTKSNLSHQSSVIESADSAYLPNIRFSVLDSQLTQKLRKTKLVKSQYSQTSARVSARCISQVAELWAWWIFQNKSLISTLTTAQFWESEGDYGNDLLSIFRKKMTTFLRRLCKILVRSSIAGPNDRNPPKIRLKNSWNWLVIVTPATVSQILNMKPSNHRKWIWCKSADICQEKFVKARQVNLFFGGFQPFGTTVCLCSLLTADYCVSRRPSTLFAHFWNLSSSGRPKPAIFAVNFAWMPHT